MDLATEAVNANGNALANQQKYEESLAGKTQALKTELSALWIELLDSNALKELVDSVKEMIVSLEDSTTGLKPVINMLSKILGLISSIVSAIPTGGLIASILGLKYGKALLSGALVKGTYKWSGSLVKLTAAFKDASTAEASFGTKVVSIFATNPFGYAIIALTGLIALFNKLYKTTDELEKDYEDASSKAKEFYDDINDINKKLDEQKQIINDLSDQKLSYYDQQTLEDAKEMTRNLESQLAYKQELAKYADQDAEDAAIKKWSRAGYRTITNTDITKGTKTLNDIQDDFNAFINKYGDGIEVATSEAKEEQWVRQDILEIIKDFTEDRKTGVKKLNEVNELINEEEERYSRVIDRIAEAKENNLIPDKKDLEYKDFYDSLLWIQDIGNKILYRESWTDKHISRYSNGNNINQNQIDSLRKQITSEILRGGLMDQRSFGYFIKNITESGVYEELYKQLYDEGLSIIDLVEDIKTDVINELSSASDEINKSEKKKPISLANWYELDSNIPDKKWKDVTDSVESGLNSLGDLLDKYQKGNEEIDLLDIYNITDANDSIFKALGLDSFDIYLDKAEGDIEQALISFIRDVYSAFIKAVGDTTTIEGFDKLTEKLTKWLNEAKGGSNKVKTLTNSYEDLSDIYRRVLSGESLNEEEMIRLITTYDSLQDAVKITSDGYTVEKDSLKSLLNQYIEFSNEAIAAEYRQTQNELTSIQTKVAARGIEMEQLRDYLDIWRRISDSWDNVQTGGIDNTLNRESLLGSGLTQEQRKNIGRNSALLNEYVEKEDRLKELQELIDKLLNDKSKLGGDNNNEIDWIANSLENLSRQIEFTQQKYDNLFSPTGSKANLEKANSYLQEMNGYLQTNGLGLEKARSAYQKYLDDLNLTDDQLKRIRNVALGFEPAWTIQEFAGDSETYDKLNKALGFFQKTEDLTKQIGDNTHKIEENFRQMLQNITDYFGGTIGKLEANLSVARTTKSQQKIIDKLKEAYSEQYAMQIKIAELNKDEIEAEKLKYEWEQKLNELEAQESQTALDRVSTKYERLMSEYENRQSILEHKISLSEQKGYMANANYYKAMINNELEGAEKLLNERDRLIEILNGVDTSSENGLDVWWDTKNKIDEVTSALYESEEAVQEWQNSIDDLKYDVFTRVQDTLSGINDEAEFLAGLLKNEDLFKYIKETFGEGEHATKIFQGGYTDEGLAMLGLYETKLKTDMELAQNYADELVDINKRLADDPANVKLLDRRNELLSQQREAIQAAEEEKQAILDLIREGYDKQLESLQTLVDKYMEVLNQEKKMYDYEKSITDKTKDIAKIRKQLAAYAQDDSEAAKSRVQQLTVQLREAEEDLQSSEWDHYLDEQQQILDKLYSNFENYLDDQMEDRDARLKEIYDLVDHSFKNISDILTGTASGVGASMSATMANIFFGSLSDLSSMEEAIDSSDTNLDAIRKSTTDVDTFLTNYANNYQIKLKNILSDPNTKIAEIESRISALNTNFNASGYLSMSKSDVNAYQDEILNKVDEVIGSKDDKLTAEDIKQAVIAAIQAVQLKDIGTTVGSVAGNVLSNLGITSGSLSSTNTSSSQKYFMGEFTSDNLESKHLSDAALRNLYNHMTSVVEKYGSFDSWTDPDARLKKMKKWLKNNGYATGAKRIKKNEYAWTQEKGFEAIIRPSDGAILTPLAKNDSVLNASATQNIWDMANNPMQFIKDNLSIPVSVSPALSGGNYDIQQSVAITLPNVTNYNEFVSELQRDKKFEKMIQDMTVNQLTNKNALAKYKYKF